VGQRRISGAGTASHNGGSGFSGVPTMAADGAPAAGHHLPPPFYNIIFTFVLFFYLKRTVFLFKKNLFFYLKKEIWAYQNNGWA
jgi:hypothetical protein